MTKYHAVVTLAPTRLGMTHETLEDAKEWVGYHVERFNMQINFVERLLKIKKVRALIVILDSGKLSKWLYLDKGQWVESQ